MISAWWLIPAIIVSCASGAAVMAAIKLKSLAEDDEAILKAVYERGWLDGKRSR